MRRNIRTGVRLKYLSRSGRFPSGNDRWYFRPHGERGIAMPDLPISHPEFIMRHAGLMRDRGQKQSPHARADADSLSRAIRDYLASAEFLSLAPLTRDDRRRIYEKLEADYGTAKVPQIEPKHIRIDLSKHKPNPANNCLKCWRALMSWLIERGAIDIDPARQVSRRKAPKSDGHLAWTRLDLEKFRAHWPHDTPQRLCMELLYRSCAAMVDACAMTRGNIKDGWLVYTRSKSKSIATVPWSARNAPAWFEWNADLEVCLRTAPAHIAFLVTRSGQPRSHRAVSQWFSRTCTRTGLDPRKSAHGLRKLRAAMFRENGATKDQRMAILGHETAAEAEHYDKSADLRRVVMGQQSSWGNKCPTLISERPTGIDLHKKIAAVAIPRGLEPRTC